MALTFRRTTIAALASAIAAASLAAGVAGRSCSVTSPGPEAVVHDLLSAAKAQDRRAVFELLAPATQKRIEDRARRATDLVGSSRRFSPIDLISIGATEGAPPTDITTVERLGPRAVVEIVSAAGRARLNVVEVDGRWLVELPGYGQL
ncbi:MAG: hypothetical protein R3B48_15820 [Kofleriaceae bacterium]